MLIRNLIARFTAASLLILLMPALAVLGLAVLASMGRPILFRQKRSGLGGRTFRLCKFRSMRSDTDETGRLLPDELRVTSTGKFLRRSRLDELPGLWNVVCGDMAYVGPRPLLPETIAMLGNRGKERGSVRPGLTGWAQVNGNTLLDLDRKVELDLWYVRNADILLDLRILFLTFWVMLGGERLTSITHEEARR